MTILIHGNGFSAICAPVIAHRNHFCQFQGKIANVSNIVALKEISFFSKNNEINNSGINGY